MRELCSRPPKHSARRLCGASTTIFLYSRLSFWNGAIRSFPTISCHQPTHVRGKNAADVALAIDAVDLTYSDVLYGYLLMSSDSDFTRLAQRRRVGRFAVYGFGESSTLQAFGTDCHRCEIVGKGSHGATAAPDGQTKGTER